ncbi:hypothetical protein BGZ70_001218 [Mortierella alpina]|uniref:PIN domain-like protein n=1 Tax=Mortierella alpina TaxID=64518 RepID=A0A9P6IW93_MORAP|nr:hypothetical protein BGZ70_001218 [Mortierella alpina]
MGVTSLAKLIKETDGRLATDLRDPGCQIHLDFLATYYHLLQSRCADILKSTCSRPASSTSGLSEDFAQLDPMMPMDRQIQLIVDDHAPEEVFICHEKAIATTGYRSVGHLLHRVLGKCLEQETTVIHVDGDVSEQKRNERQSRAASLTQQLQDIRDTVDVPSIKNRKQIYRRCRNAYRVPRKLLEEEILQVLEDKGWTIHRCPFQADTCIANCFQVAQEQDSIRIVTRDSDLMLYEGIPSIIMPIGKDHALTTFSKEDLLSKLDLPSEKHLVLAGIVTSNDYVKNIKHLGLLRNCEIVREMNLANLEPIGAVERNAVRAASFHSYIGEYLRCANASMSVDRSRYSHAITAFIERIETPIQGPEQPADIYPAAHDELENVFNILLSSAPSRKKLSESTARPADAPDPLLDLSQTDSTAPSGSVVASRVDGRSRRYRSQKDVQHRRARATSFYGKKKSASVYRAWRMSRFKSRTDMHPRHAARTVELRSARRVDPEDLQSLRVSVPRPHVAKAHETRRQEPKAVKTVKRVRKGTKRRDVAAASKVAFSRTFAISTQTIGCVQGCMARALPPMLTREDVRKLADRLNNSIKTINSARMYVWKMVEIIIYGDLLSATEESISSSDSAMASDFEGSDSDVPSTSQRSSAESIPDPQASALDTPRSPLDMLLVKSTGTLIIRNLFALALNGKFGGGRPAQKAASVQGRQIAKDTFEKFKQILPNFEPINKDELPLSILQEDVADDLFTALRAHFRKLPGTICDKMAKAGFSEEDIPEIEAVDEDDEDDEEQEEEEEKMTFHPGHIVKWWQHYQTLPRDGRPVFVPSTGFSDSFVRVQERALIAIFWSKKGNPAERSASKMMSRKAAEGLVKADFGALIRILFYGAQQQDEESAQSLSSYGKRTSTMRDLALEQPAKFGTQELERYLERKFAYIAHARDCQAQGVPVTVSSPPLPINHDRRSRYVVNNMLSTDGVRLNVMVYDTTKAHGWKDPSSFVRRIENAFPTQESVQAVFQKPAPDIRVVGVDPGERNVAAFCCVTRANDRTRNQLGRSIVAKNLVMSRTSLYAPALAYRAMLQDLKSQRVRVDLGAQINGAIWSDMDRQGSVGLPTIYDMENLLQGSTFGTMAEMEDALRRYACVEPVLHEFYSSEKVKRMRWELSKATRAEMDWAISAALKDCPPLTLFAYGNGSFRTGLNLASKHETFKQKFAARTLD